MSDKQFGKIILASSSPRRKLILSEITSRFEIVVPVVDETEEGSPSEVCLMNAVKKGDAVKDSYDVLIACDTLVALGDKIYGKPYDVDNAVRMLKELCGKTHSVYSGLYVKTKNKNYKSVVESKVTMKEMTDADIISYVEKYRPLDKAGSYGIQDSVVVEGYEGDYDNIVGLPKAELMRILGEIYGER